MCGVKAMRVFVFAVVMIVVQTEEIKLTKRQVEDKWSWGYVDSTPTNNNVSPRQPTDSSTIPTSPITSELPPATTPVFCLSSYEPPQKPNFTAPGRRINEAKCYEYIWELNNRKREKEQDVICRKYIKKKWGNKGGQHGIGGRATKPGEFPHMAAVGWKATIGTWVFKCGSFLISKKFVLTAGHCTKASPRDSTIADIVPKIVRIGDKNIIDKQTYNSPPRIDTTISRIIVHPKYEPPVKYYDIALMELNEEVQFTKFVQPACLWNKFDTSELGKQAVGTGWGVIESSSLDISPELQAVTVDVLENSLCDQLLKTFHNRNWGGFHEDQLCAGKLAGGVDSCKGDSGGPLQIKMPLPTDVTEKEGSMHYAVGIISFGMGCAHENLPGIYTRVSSFIDWIEENVWPNE